ncbi:addiction module protein [Arcticibacter eurypsychrophilus]|uniref:addiction module protein n=1 Tax=Arcticibacter eurypsychrophilus TaxID=1434752 RepID=UPI00084D18B8|nr:addiction module protein [Arcticibacter eurypsychrophilus]
MIAIELSFRQLKDAVKQLSPSEKLDLNEVIWSEDITIPIEHQSIVNERVAEYKNNPEILLDWDIASKKLKS